MLQKDAKLCGYMWVRVAAAWSPLTERTCGKLNGLLIPKSLS